MSGKVAARFSKSKLIAAVEARAEMVKATSGFVEGNGSSQLWRRGDDDAMKERLDRAIEYGRWRALQEVAYDVNTGYMGAS